MRIAIYGGSFNPPHLGHVRAAQAACMELQPDKLLIIPTCVPPHKTLDDGEVAPEMRLEMARMAFSRIDCAEVSDLEIARGGVSYTVDTLRQLEQMYPGAELCLLMGMDMFLSLEQWREADYVLSHARICVFPRVEEERAQIREMARALEQRCASPVTVIGLSPFPTASTRVRECLRDREGRELLTDRVYAYIIRHRLYGAQPELEWMRKKAYPYLKLKRVPHVRGTEEEAVRLAKHWGADPFLAAEAGILHDITKKLNLQEQLILCEKYGIINDTSETETGKLLHAKTGAALARDLFGVNDQVYDAIRWHTTGRGGMSLLEKIIYMADYMEPNRDFEGVEELRRLAYTDLDKAMILGLEMSMADLRARGTEPDHNSVEALVSLGG